MIKLDKVSKYYYSNGMVSSGISKVSLEFNMGEFIAITGASGSGKSTLLNVISGLDTYEDGEMYINGKETSHYTEREYEDYRRNYIGNIFQNFNLINSYTVYQNVELVLLLNGYKRREVKSRILDILKKVGLYKYRHTKVSKLSGGMKQRVAIARCLAKDTPIIIADEPTGNLDSRSAESIIKLLSEISEYKLVIIVTHNYDQVSEYVTRKITMHDGRVIEDNKIKDYKKVDNFNLSTNKDAKIVSKLRLGIRNTFNILPKFLLLSFVYLFIIFAISMTYASFQKGEYESSISGSNAFFNTKDLEKRIIIRKLDGTNITDEEYESISHINNVDYIVRDDLVLDNQIDIYDNDVYLYGYANEASKFKGKVDLGRNIENDNEIIVSGSKNSWYLSDGDKILDKELNIEGIYNSDGSEYKVKIVGISYDESREYELDFYMSSTLINKFNNTLINRFSKMSFLFNDKLVNYDYVSNDMLVSSDKVPEGTAFISENDSYNCKKGNCKKTNLEVSLTNQKFTNKIDLTITNEYNKSNIKRLLGIDYDENSNSIYVNQADYDKLYDMNSYQSSVFIKDYKEKDSVINTLKDIGFDTFYLKDGLYISTMVGVLRIAKLLVMVALIVVLFFISYFVIKLILKSRNIYFSIIRMLGSSIRTTKRLLDIELLTITNLMYLIYITFLELVKHNVIASGMKDTLSYLGLKENIIIYVILIVMTFLLSAKYARKIFTNSSMSVYRSEV